MTFEEAIAAMAEDAVIVNRRAKAIWSPRDRREPHTCCVCGSLIQMTGRTERLTCSPECAGISRGQKTGHALRQRAIDAGLKESSGE